MKIGICEAAPQGACSYYRSIGPMSKMHKIDKNLDIIILDKITWNTLSMVDMLFLARPDSKSFIDMIEMAKNLSIPVWIDWDDNIFNITPDNPAYKNYSRKDLQESVLKCVEMADVVTVSTTELYKFYSQKNKNVFVVENAFNDYNYRLNPLSTPFKSIFWRGSNTHRNDLLSVSKDIFAANKMVDWSWVFVGGDPWYITDKINRVFYLQEVDIITYYRFLTDNRSAITMVPLVVNDFNVAKSNIGWIEGTSAGSAVIAPEGLPEFDKPGVIKYNPEKEGHFQYLLEKMMKSNEFRTQNYKKSLGYIQDNLLLSKINQKRINIIEGII